MKKCSHPILYRYGCNPMMSSDGERKTEKPLFKSMNVFINHDLNCFWFKYYSTCSLKSWKLRLQSLVEYSVAIHLLFFLFIYLNFSVYLCCQQHKPEMTLDFSRGKCKPYTRTMLYCFNMLTHHSLTWVSDLNPLQ